MPARSARRVALSLPALLLACLLCVPALAGPGGVTVAPDGAKFGADLITGRWIDVVATVDPGEGGLLLEDLEVSAAVTGEAEVAAAILTPSHTDGAYRSPFAVRVPVRPLSGGKLPVRVTVSGRRPDGSAFEAAGEATLRAWGSDPAAADEGLRVAVGTRLKAPVARVGEPNAVLVDIDVAAGWHVYGAQVDVGLPTTVELLPAGPQRLWEGGGIVTPPGDHLDGRVTVEIPFTPLIAGPVEARVSVLHMPCTEEMCDPVVIVYAPVAFEVAAADAEAPLPAEIAIAFDGEGQGLMLFAGEALDLLVNVTPKAPLTAASLDVRVVHEGEAAESGPPVFPPADAQGRYAGPFTVRVPFKPTRTGKIAVTAAVLAGGASAGAQRELDVFRPLAPLPGLEDGASGLLPNGEKLSATATVRANPVTAGEPNAVVLQVEVADGWHVYGTEEDVGQKTLVELLPAGRERNWTGGGPVTPPGKHLEHAFEIEVPFTPLDAGRVETRVRILWMACTDETCDPSRISYVPVSFTVREGDATRVEQARDEAATTGVIAKAPDDGGDDVTRMPLGTLILLSIGAGLFALAMPCTYPMIPITISFFTKQAEAREGRVVGLALTYGFGIVLIFTAIGGVVGLGTLQGDAVLDFANNAIVNAVLALLFLAFGLSLLGLFELRLPTWFDNLAMRASSGGGTLGVFAMGATLVITSFTCTAPLVGALLVAASAGGNLGRVLLGMGVFGVTMAVPFVILSMSPTAIQKMPRSGEWMKHLKVTLGIVELGLVLKFLSNIDLELGTYLIGRELFLVLWLASFAIAGLYLLGVVDLFRPGARWSLTRGRTIAAVLLLAVAGFLAQGVTGKRLPVKELEGFLPSFEHEYGDAFAEVVVDDYEAGVRRAMELGKPIFLHFTGFQ